jgi:ribosomal-protein-alanine N-acetyltransferase
MMMGDLPVDLPQLSTLRLELRAFVPADAAALGRLAAAAEAAAPTPLLQGYDGRSPESWIASQAAQVAAGRLAHWVIGPRGGEELFGSVGLVVDREHAVAQFACWLAVEHWGRGLGREAAHAALAFGFRELGLRRIWASSYATSDRSARLLDAIGMGREGLQRRHAVRLGREEDLQLWGLLRDDYERRERARWLAASARIVREAQRRMSEEGG